MSLDLSRADTKTLLKAYNHRKRERRGVYDDPEQETVVLMHMARELKRRGWKPDAHDLYAKNPGRRRNPRSYVGGPYTQAGNSEDRGFKYWTVYIPELGGEYGTLRSAAEAKRVADVYNDPTATLEDRKRAWSSRGNPRGRNTVYNPRTNPQPRHVVHRSWDAFNRRPYFAVYGPSGSGMLAQAKTEKDARRLARLFDEDPAAAWAEIRKSAERWNPRRSR